MLKSIQIKIVLIFIVIVAIIISALGFLFINIIKSNESIDVQISQVKWLIICAIGTFLIISMLVRSIYF